MLRNERKRFAIPFLVIWCISPMLLAKESGSEPNLVAVSESDFHPNSIQRPQEVKIATIGSVPGAVSAEATPSQIIQHVKSHWQSRFAQVLPDRPDLIVVPENCDRPLGMAGTKRAFDYYAVRGNQVRDYFSQVAKENRCYITYPAIRVLDDGTMRNSIVLLDRKGEVAGLYNKNHPTMGELEVGKLPGVGMPIIECDFGRVALAICFDLNFDRLRLQVANIKPDLILFCSMYHGGLMQTYWAYSCRSYFVGGIGAGGPSEIRNPLGNVVATSTNYFDYAVAEVNLDCELAHLDGNFGRLKALKAKYGTTVTISDPGQLASVLVTSSHETIGVQTMLDEFEVERLDDYLQRALAERDKLVPSSKP